MLLLPPLFAPPVAWWWALVRAGAAALHPDPPTRLKPSLQARTAINGPNRALVLTVHTEHATRRLPYPQVRIAWQHDWPRDHVHGLEAAYRNSPYFEFYWPAYVALYRQKFEFLHAWNAAFLHQMASDLGVSGLLAGAPPGSLTEKKYPHPAAGRVPEWSLTRACAPPNFPGIAYPKTFDQALPNPSGFDLLFNCGPEAVQILQSAAATPAH